MKKLIVIFLILLISNISSAQSGWGYVNYTSYKTHAGNGSTSQYPQFANNAAGFDVMFNTANSNTTITHTGEVPISYLYNGSLQTPHWNSDFYGFKFEFWFIPQQTGTYYFATNSDDASDILIDGVVVASYYGGHGAGGYQTGSKSMIAGQRYSVVYRGQEYGGGDVFYFQWYRPVGGWGYWTNEVTNKNSEPTKKGIINFDFGSTLDETKFSASALALNSSGQVNVTNALDSNKIANGNKGTIVSGQVEWSYINVYNSTNTLYIDLRKFGNTDISTITQIKILDVYEGPVTYAGSNIYWAYYTIPSSIPKLTDGTSTFNSYIRNAGYGNYAFACDITFASYMQYKTQSVTMTTTNTLSTLYNSIVTVSDVYLAFKELANGGIFGNQTGNEFIYGIQYKNADINDDGTFNEADCFSLLQHLTGKKNLVDTFNLRKTLKLIPTTTYNTIGKSNWNTFPSYLDDTYSFDINTGKSTDTLNISATWKGDVNLSHSATPASNGITTMTIRAMSIPSEINFIYDTEIVGDSIVVTVKINPLQQQLAAVQFDLNFDKSINYSSTNFGNLSTMNFARLGSNVVSIGSINTSGQPLGNTSYTISFKSNVKIDNILGLISISNYEAIDINGKSLKVKVL